MKKLFKPLLVLLLIVASLVSTVSCRDDGYKKYSISGLNFRLPSDMKKTNVNYASISYWNGEAEFFAEPISRDALLSEFILDKDISASEFADVFVAVNEYENVEKTYNEENGSVTLAYVYEPEEQFYCDFIIRNEAALYLVTMCCDVKYMEKYKPIFAEWISYISIGK